jgi:hypothetical protein
MKFVTCLLIGFTALVMAASASAFELKPAEPERRLRIEIAPAPPIQKEFDRYVRELAAAARRDAEAGGEEFDRQTELRAKRLNPVTVLRW